MSGPLVESPPSRAGASADPGNARGSAGRGPGELLLDGAGAWIWLILAAVAGTALVFTGLRWLLPLGQAALAWPVLFRDLRAGRLGRAAAHMIFWSVVVSVCTIEVTIHFPAASQAAIIKSTEYREEMFTWIRSGAGPEGSPRLFLPQHLYHYALTLLLSALTAGFAGLVLGSILLNYMNYYVGALVLEGARPVLGSAFGWPIWAVLRVVAFVLGAIAAAQFGLARGAKRAPWDAAAVRRTFTWSLAFFVADLVIKAVLAHPWRSLLVRALLP